jgi:hypothetical protein
VSGPRLGNTRRTERAGVRAVTDFFESNDCVVQPINGENDFGKDLYVDLTQAEVITGTTGAIQVKSGSSYRTANGYRIPIDHHLHCWRDSTVPVIGIVCDEERSLMFWTNLTQYLRTRTDELQHVPVSSNSVLDRTALPALEASIRETAVGTHPLVELWSTNALDAPQAVWDCLAVGRRDQRVFMGLRSAIPLVQAEALPAIIRILSSLTSHPDRGWSSSNWIEQSVRTNVRATFRWTPTEAIRMVHAAEGEWERGTVGQDVSLLFADDPDIRDVLDEAVRIAYVDNFDDAWMLFCLRLHFVDEDAAEVMASRLSSYPEFRRHPAFREVAEHIEAMGYLASPIEPGA